MSFLSSLRVELNRIFKSRLSWVFIVLAAASPLFGFTFFRLNAVETASTQMIINPLLTGTIGSGILFALFTLFELDRVNKHKISMLTDAIAPPIILHASKIIAVFSVSIAACLFTLLVYYPYTMISMGSFFDLFLYVSVYLVFMLPAMWIGVLLAAIFYQLFRRVDISFVFIAACALANYSNFITGDFILRWINPLLPVFSDGFGNVKPLRIGLYNRLFLLVFLSGFWFLSLMFTRKYEKGILGSIAHNINKLYLPVIGAALLLISANIYKSQPFFNNAPAEVDWDEIDNTGAELSFDSISAEVYPDLAWGILYGKIVYILSNDNNQAVTKRLVMNSGYKVYSITANGRPVNYIDLDDHNYTVKHVEFEVPEGSGIELVIEYGGYPHMWGAYKSFGIGSAEVSPEYIELPTNSLIPTQRAFGTDARVRIVLPDHLTLLLMQNNAAVDVIDNNDGTKTWILTNEYDSFDIYASDYVRKIVNAETMSAEFYYHRKFSYIMEQNSVDEVLGDVFNYCTKNFGPLNYLEDGALKLIQTTAFNFGGGAVPGVSVMSEQTFSIYSLSDPWKGAVGKEILAHEIIHQWWGLNRMIWGDPDYPAWTPEGLTVYSTYRLYKEKYGEEYGRMNYVEKWEKAVEAMRRNFYYRHPEYLDIMPKDFADRVSINEIETRKYSLAPLMIYKAEQLVGGEEAMDEILKALAQTNNYEQLTLQEFLDACGLTLEDIYID